MNYWEKNTHALLIRFECFSNYIDGLLPFYYKKEKCEQINYYCFWFSVLYRIFSWFIYKHFHDGFYLYDKKYISRIVWGYCSGGSFTPASDIHKSRVWNVWWKFHLKTPPSFLSKTCSISESLPNDDSSLKDAQDHSHGLFKLFPRKHTCGFPLSLFLVSSLGGGESFRSILFINSIWIGLIWIAMSVERPIEEQTLFRCESINSIVLNNEKEEDMSAEKFKLWHYNKAF